MTVSWSGPGERSLGALFWMVTEKNYEFASESPTGVKASTPASLRASRNNDRVGWLYRWSR